MSPQEQKPTQALFLPLFSLRERRHPIPGVSSGSGRMLLFPRPGDRLVLGGGERGRGGTETQPPEGDSHSGSAGEKRTPDHHNPAGIPPGGGRCFREHWVTLINCSPPPAGGLQPGLVRPASRGFVSRLARGGPGLADRQPLLGREDHRGGGHIGLLPAALLLRAGWSSRPGVEAGLLPQRGATLPLFFFIAGTLSSDMFPALCCVASRSS